MLKIGYVVETHPEDNSVDVVMADNGARLVGVQVGSPDASTRTGTVGMPKITPKGKDKWDITKPSGQDMKALVGFVGRNPVVVGFLYPQINQMALKDPLARRFRHQSDVETLIDGDGNVQISHPSGTYIRIGEEIDRDTLDGKYADASSSDRNTAKRVNIHIGLAGGTLEFTMTPDGAVSLRCNHGVSIDAGQASTFKAPEITLDASKTTVTGDLDVLGTTTLRDVTSNDVNIGSDHQHTNSGGPGLGGVPVS